jgi:hypothetical protein
VGTQTNCVAGEIQDAKEGKIRFALCEIVCVTSAVAVGQQDIDRAMQGKGFTRVQESQKPDLILAANGWMKQQTSYSAWGMRRIGGEMGIYYPSAERRRDFDRRSVQLEHPVSGVAWKRSGHVE